MSYDPEDVFDALYIDSHPEEFDVADRHRARATLDSVEEDLA